MLETPFAVHFVEEGSQVVSVVIARVSIDVNRRGKDGSLMSVPEVALEEYLALVPYLIKWKVWVELAEALEGGDDATQVLVPQITEVTDLLVAQSNVLFVSLGGLPLYLGSEFGCGVGLQHISKSGQ